MRVVRRGMRSSGLRFRAVSGLDGLRVLLDFTLIPKPYDCNRVRGIAVVFKVRPLQPEGSETRLGRDRAQDLGFRGLDRCKRDGTPETLQTPKLLNLKLYCN